MKLKILLRIYLKVMPLFSCRFWGVLFSTKLQIIFTDKLTSYNLKILFTSPVGPQLQELSYLRCYFHDFRTNASMMVTMLLFTVRVNVILKSQF